MRSRVWHHFLVKSSFACPRTPTGGCMWNCASGERRSTWQVSWKTSLSPLGRSPPSFNEASQTGAEQHQVVLTGGQWSKHTDPEPAADRSSGLRDRPSFTVRNDKPETSNRRLASLHFFSDWLVPQTHDGDLGLAKLHVWAQMHRLWHLLKMYVTGCDWTPIKIGMSQCYLVTTWRTRERITAALPCRDRPSHPALGCTSITIAASLPHVFAAFLPWFHTL